MDEAEVEPETDREQLAERLEELATTLSPREQTILCTLLFRAMDPLQRVLLTSQEALDPAEEKCLEELEEALEPWRTSG